MNTDLMEVGGGEILDLRGRPTAVEAVTRAEIDIQINTARRFPRSVHKFVQDAKTMVAIDPDLAAQCTYVLKGKKKSDGSPVSGPSVRLAEICAICWGNIRVVGRITDDDGRFITAQATALDLERNVGYTVEVKQGVTRADGQRYGDDMIRVASMAAIAKATRNATYKVVPLALVHLIEDEAHKVAKGDVKALPERTDRAVAWFVGKGVEAGRVFDALGIAGPGDMTLDLLATLNGWKVAINEHHAEINELFPVPTTAVELAGPSAHGNGNGNGSKSGRLAGKLAASKPEPREPGSDG